MHDYINGEIYCMEWRERELTDAFTWNERAWIERKNLLSRWIGNDIYSIVDLGAGNMSLKNILPKCISYYPVDYIARSDQTIVADFNNYEFPELSVDCCFCSGVLEYIKDLDWFVKKLHQTGCKYILTSYSIRQENESIEERRSRAWVNDYTFNQLVDLFQKNGFILTDWNKHFEYSPLLKFERSMPSTLIKNYFCTGCSACAESCTIGALTMRQDSEGFYKPVLDSSKCVGCRKCIESCHVLHEQSLFLGKPKVFAYQAKEEIRKRSSSGGIFWHLAKKTIDQKGVVFGAVWNENFTVEHRYIECVNEIELMQHSKYMQSEIKNSYRQAEKFLKDGRVVLFTGTPCQIAGLKSFLKKDYYNLITIDLICHYVPSPKYFKKYLDENYGVDNVSAFTFRDKTYGWSYDHMGIELKNGKILDRNYTNDRLQQGFHTRLFMNDTCAHCRYADYPRQADITIGDYWGKFDDLEWNDGLGTSEIIINSEKGDIFFQSIKAKAFKCQEMPIETTYGNRIKETYLVHPEQGHFKELVKKESFNDAVDRALNRKFQIGIVGDWAVENYGADITYYALYSVLHDQLGKDVLMVERPENSIWTPKTPPTLFMELPYPKYAIEPYAREKSEMYKLNERCDMFVVGSDQIWNNILYYQFGEFADLHWVNNDRKKIAYATSFGADYINGTDEERQKFSVWLQKFDAISVREKSGVQILKEQYGVDGTWVLDPVFLCEKNKYVELSMRGGARERQKENYMFSYMLDLNGEKVSFLNMAFQKTKMPLVVVTDAAKNEIEEQQKWNISITTGVSEEAWLAYFINAEYVVTDSFHGMCFAILFHKPFIAIVNGNRGATRFYSLLKLLGLLDYLAKDMSEAEEKLNLLEEMMDWDHIDSLLAKEKERCIEWLKNSIDMPINRKMKTSYDLLAPSVEQHNDHVQYIDNFSYMDVLPSQSTSGKRTRLAIGDQCLLFQVFDNKANLEQNLSIASQQEIQPLRKLVEEHTQNIKDLKIDFNNETDTIAENIRKIEKIESKIEDVKQELIIYSSRLDRIENSWSYKIGRIITFIPRKILLLFRK